MEIDGITHDSRRVTPGSMFCCVRGAVRDGHDFAGVAVERGATALLVDHRLDDLDRVTQLGVGHVRAAICPMASELFGNPSRHMS
ncbi:MAG: Mur ligase domain-containing protein, partial [Ilumatobacteraceae bacterium]